MNKWAIWACIGLSACNLDQKKFQDPIIDRAHESIKTALLEPTNERPPQLATAPSSSAAALLPKILQQKVTIELNESKDIKEVFMDLCRAAKINVVVEKEIEGSIFYHAKSRPLIEVVQSICEILNLRFRYEKNLLYIERDVPYLKTYDVQFLNMSRETKNNVSITNNILSKSSTTGVGANGSTTEISSRAENDFWEELKHILRNLLQVPKTQLLDEDSEKIEEKKILPLQGQLKDSQTQNVRVHEKKKIKQKGRPSFAIHRQTGLITIYGTQKNHHVVEQFLTKLKKQMGRQILIEAKILEVTLKEEYKSGIDWQRIGEYGLGNYAEASKTRFQGDLSASALFGAIAQKTPTVITTPETSQVISLGGRGHSLSAILNFMETFGVVRTLSSPRLTVLNNQTALLKVAENFVFFNVTGERQFLNSDSTNYGSLVSANSSPQTIPIGFVMSVQPAIDVETQDIIINLRPTITRLIDTKQDPAVVLLNQSLQNPSHHVKSEFPVIAVREMDSILRIKSGTVAILGGLMIEGAETGRAGIPGTSEGPFSFFTSAKRQAKAVTELVIFLRATILEGAHPDSKDQQLYREFSLDSRHLNWKEAA
ncbi:MAG: hypothetical protein A2621_00950 [Alphaproteobacteria bacterium RIFCSPHIGHO2_01_FULL_41_14]|nr:MAG: hypothetical protein A2065_01200 [Alphaproteobacteria bacterium GWB1_45_5]OFW76248.1 MAG: hypothetical protein A3K20_01840 [Alphaproteobacteria bacterium GWA1_45_9]OFW89480.1 MAG: hypothetical protein A2621_00950 [Alphaproteobacteria bacterium RIFCSPHIGHO2_01_FULL_41_14]HCI48617.1 hypothetical protein [Holosporales bacterium]